MIDEKRLDEIEHKWAEANGPEGGIVMAQECAYEHFQELIRLARLGLWAEKHGVPAMKAADEYWDCLCEMDDPKYCAEYSQKAMDMNCDALAALPKAEGSK